MNTKVKTRDQKVKTKKDTRFNTLEHEVTSYQKTDQKLDKLARRKTFSVALTKQLSNLPNTSLKYNYTLANCATILEQQGKKIKSKYCGYRWCAVCNANKTAKMINSYKHELEANQDNLWLITLTRQTVFADELEPTICEMIKNFTRLRKNALKTYNLVIKGIRTTECNYSLRIENNYVPKFNPHFHFLFIGKPCEAILIKSLWMNYYSKSEVDPKAQDIRKADKETMLEVFKYAVKTTSKDDKLNNFDAWSVDVIYHALQNKKTTQGYRLKANKQKQENDLEYLGVPFQVAYFGNFNYYDQLGGDISHYTPTEKDQTYLTKLRYI